MVFLIQTNVSLEADSLVPVSSSDGRSQSNPGDCSQINARGKCRRGLFSYNGSLLLSSDCALCQSPPGVLVWFLREPGDLLAMALGDITDVFRTAACARALPVFYLACLL